MKLSTPSFKSAKKQSFCLSKYTHHLFIVFISLMGIACEWKPPRRPIKKISEKLALSTESKQQDLSQETDQKPQSKNVPDKYVNPSEPVTQSVQPTQDSKSLKLAEKNTEKNTEKQAEQIAESQAEPQTEILSLEQQLRERDYLLTIDPDGPPLIHLKEFTIALDVVNREPKNEQNVISSRQKQVFAYLRVRNFEKPQKIQIKWIHQDEIVQVDRLQIGISPRWRTWSSLRFNKTKKHLGEWRIEVSTGSGKLIGLTHFVRFKHSK